MNLVKRVCGFFVLLLGVAFGWGFVEGFRPMESINWFAQFLVLVATLVFLKVGWGLLKAETMQLSRRTASEAEN
jgi:hypothetical protein